MPLTLTRRAMSDPSLTPTPIFLRRAHSSKRAVKYFERKEPTAEQDSVSIAMKAQPVPPEVAVVGVVVGVDAPKGPLRLGQPVRVMKAGEWIDEYASVKAVRPDGTRGAGVR